MKNKMIKMQHNSLYTLTKELTVTVYEILSTEEKKLNFSVIVVSKNLTSFVISKFPALQS